MRKKYVIIIAIVMLAVIGISIFVIKKVSNKTYQFVVKSCDNEVEFVLCEEVKDKPSGSTPWDYSCNIENLSFKSIIEKNEQYNPIYIDEKGNEVAQETNRAILNVEGRIFLASVIEENSLECIELYKRFEIPNSESYVGFSCPVFDGNDIYLASDKVNTFSLDKLIGVKSFDQLVEFYNKTNLKFDIDKAEQTIYVNVERSGEDIIDKIKLVFSNDGLKIAYLPNEDNNAN